MMLREAKAIEWPEEAPVAWDRYWLDLVAVDDVHDMATQAPGVHGHDADGNRFGVTVTNLIPLTPFCADLIAALVTP